MSSLCAEQHLSATGSAVRQRNLGLDGLRILSMLGVVFLHLITHGMLRVTMSKDVTSRLLVDLFYILCLTSINCFVMISGFCQYGKPVRINRLVNLWAQVTAYNFLLTVAVNLRIFPDSPYWSDIVFSLFPLLSDAYWFFSIYFFLSLFTPFLDRLLDTLSQKAALSGICLSVLLLSVFSDVAGFLGRDPFRVSGGARITWFFTLYLVGAYLKKYGVPRWSSRALLFGFLIFGVHWLYDCLLSVLHPVIPGLTLAPDLFCRYNSFFSFSAAVCLFCFFSQLNIPHKSPAAFLIGTFSPLCFGVYLIHDNFWVRQFYVAALSPFPALRSSPWYIWLAVLFGEAIAIFLLCSLVEWIRQQVFRLLKINTVCHKLAAFITSAASNAVAIFQTMIGGINDQ